MKQTEDNDIDLTLALQPRVEKFIRPYPTLDVRMTYQNFGSMWLCILRGRTEDIELVGNGLFNFMATNGEISFIDGSKTMATFWTKEEKLQRFFYNVSVFSGNTRWRGKRVNNDEANKRIAYLHANAHENFMNFDEVHFAPDTYSVGKISAERPDNDFKDRVLVHAHSDKTEKQTIDNG